MAIFLISLHFPRKRNTPPVGRGLRKYGWLRGQRIVPTPGPGSLEVQLPRQRPGHLAPVAHGHHRRERAALSGLYGATRKIVALASSLTSRAPSCATAMPAGRPPTVSPSSTKPAMQSP